MSSDASAVRKESTTRRERSDEARVQDRGVLAFEQAEASDGGRESQVRVGEFVADDLGGAGFPWCR